MLTSSVVSHERQPYPSGLIADEPVDRVLSNVERVGILSFENGDDDEEDDDDYEDDDEAPETPSDEPPPVPIQDPPADATPEPPMTVAACGPS